MTSKAEEDDLAGNEGTNENTEEVGVNASQ